MIVFVDIAGLGWFSVDNNSCSSRISHEVSAMWSIIYLLSCNTPIYNIYSNTPDFDVFVIWPWPMLYIIPFVLLLNFHFWNYYVSSQSYVRELLSNHLYPTSSEQLSLASPFSLLPLLTFCRQENRTRVKYHIPWSCSSPQLSHPRNIAPSPSIYTYTLPS